MNASPRIDRLSRRSAWLHEERIRRLHELAQAHPAPWLHGGTTDELIERLDALRGHDWPRVG